MSNDAGITVQIDDETQMLLIELADVRAAKAEIAKREQQLRTTILDTLGSATIGLTASGERCCSIQIQERAGVDRKKLEALYPDVYDEVQTSTEVKVLKVGD